ncbi:MAG: hypothetical protein ACYC7I_08590, partial [Gammaproteobacteria bacterium]
MSSQSTPLMPNPALPSTAVMGVPIADEPIRVGVYTDAGRRDENQDFAAVSLGHAWQRTLRGTVAALADGVGGARGGRAAAESAVRGFIEGYYQAAETLTVERAAARALAAVNRWVHAQG